MDISKYACKGEKNSDGIFNLAPSSKNGPSLTLKVLTKSEIFRFSDLVRGFWGWGQIENTFWDFLIFTIYIIINKVTDEQVISYELEFYVLCTQDTLYHEPCLKVRMVWT